MALVALGAISLVLRGVAFSRYRFDSDEPQHLHVAWGWTAGLVQYRDFFDNHAPLFHLLMAPILRLVGEREDALLFMRIPMLPLWLLVLVATGIVARRLYSARVAAWAVLLLAVLPPFFLKSLEFRTDNLWVAVWAGILIVLTGRELTAARAFVIGLLLGIALCVSLKTILLIVTLLGAAVIVKLITAVTATATAAAGRMTTKPKSRPESMPDWTRARITTWLPTPTAATALAALAGFAILPALLATYFIRVGAWPKLVYCVFTFNELLTQTRNPWIGRALYPFALAAVLAVAWRMRKSVTDDREWWRFFWGVAAALFTITLACFWILISPRDLLPILPLFAIFFVARIERTRHATAILTITAVVCLVLVWHYAEHFRDATTEHYTMIRQVLGVSRPGEYLMDIKGETIFRPRPYYFIFELITRSAMERGLIADTIAEELIAKRVHVAQADGPFLPKRGAAFLNANFVDLGRIRASGQWLGDDGSFSIAIPGQYVVLSEFGRAIGTLDGTPQTGPRVLAAGAHRFERALAGERLVVLWAPAFARGYSPFHHRDKEF
jgi:hypothetical protein